MRTPVPRPGDAAGLPPETAIRQAIDACYGKEDADEDVSLFSLPDTAKVSDDGTIVMSGSGWASGRGRNTHWTGWHEVAPGDPDHALWLWIIKQGDRFAGLIGPTKLEAIREAFRKEI